MIEEEIIKRLKKIWINLHEAQSFHDRAALDESIKKLESLLKELSIQVPNDIPYLSEQWIKWRDS